MRELEHWVGGKAVAGASGRSGPVFDPARGVQTATVPFASADEVGAAVDVATEAAAEWGAGSLSSRAAVLFRFRDLVAAATADLAAAVTAEHGKVLSDAAGEVARGLENIEFACGIPHLLKGSHSTEVSTGVDVHTVLEPLGVVAGITPFNFPVMVPLWMLANAIACGNAFVLKPSEKDPSPSLLLAELARDAGVPDGVLNVVHGDAEAVDALLAHPDVAAVSFVGSTPIARHIYETGARHGKRVQALGGAKNHMVVLPDAVMDKTVDGIIGSAFGAAGQRCMAGSVVVTVGDAHARLVERLRPATEALRVGDGMEEGVAVGPLVSKAAQDRVKGWIEKGLAEGAKLIVDGRNPDAPDEGAFIGPTIVQVEPGMEIGREEVFGPVLSLIHVDTFDEAIDLVNSSRYGNGTSIFTESGASARRFRRDVQVGMIGVNIGVAAPVAFFPF